MTFTRLPTYKNLPSFLETLSLESKLIRKKTYIVLRLAQKLQSPRKERPLPAFAPSVNGSIPAAADKCWVHKIARGNAKGQDLAATPEKVEAWRAQEHRRKWQIPNAAQKQVGEIHQKWGKYTPKYASCLEDSKDWFYVHILSLIQLLNQAHAIFKLWGPCFIVKTKQNKLLGAVKTLVQICPS